MKNGWIYILTNPSMQGLVKVGLTTTSPDQRMKELSSATGVATKFDLHSFFEVSDVEAAETKAHRILERVYGRPNKLREFFETSASEAHELLSAALAEFFVSGENMILKEAERLIMQKSFTLATLQFEAEFLREYSRLGGMTSKLASYYGAYLAACATTDRSPLSPQLLTGKYANSIMEKAISIASHITNEPEDLIINFVREMRT